MKVLVLILLLLIPAFVWIATIKPTIEIVIQENFYAIYLHYNILNNEYVVMQRKRRYLFSINRFN
jgi:hypothetical protein